MKLYHGSTVIVDKPLVSFGRDNLDFGKGFYTTSIQNQAEEWILRFILLLCPVALPMVKQQISMQM